MTRIAGKTAFVTGGASGIGLAIGTMYHGSILGTNLLFGTVGWVFGGITGVTDQLWTGLAGGGQP